MTNPKFRGWMSRQGHEKIETQIHFMNHSMECTLEACETAAATIGVDSNWNDLASLLVRTDRFQTVT